MCGIAGMVHLDGAAASPVSLKRMTDAIAHRGPDGEGQWVDRNVGLGHRRLAIIDLTPGGHQPMVSADHRAGAGRLDGARRSLGCGDVHRRADRGWRLRRRHRPLPSHDTQGQGLSADTAPRPRLLPVAPASRAHDRRGVTREIEVGTDVCPHPRSHARCRVGGRCRTTPTS